MPVELEPNLSENPVTYLCKSDRGPIPGHGSQCGQQNHQDGHAEQQSKRIKDVEKRDLVSMSTVHLVDDTIENDLEGPGFQESKRNFGDKSGRRTSNQPPVF